MAGSVAAGPGEEAADQAAVGAKPCFVMRWMTTLTVLGCALGAVTGTLCHVLGAPDQAVKLIQLPGELFLRALKAVVVPMVFASMVSNAASLNETGGANRMASMAIKYYLSTTFVAALEGVLLFNVFRFSFEPVGAPASPAAAPTAAPKRGPSSTVLDTFLDFSRDLVPENVPKAMLEMQLLGIITFAVFFGAMLSQTPGGRPVIQFFGACFDTLVEMIRRIILFTPLGVGSLVSRSIAQSSDLGSALGNIGKLLGVVALGQAIHVFLFYSCVYGATTRRNPFRYFSGMANMWITAFGTSSSAATLSTTCKTCEDHGISKRTINFVCPIGCTVNMDGGALERPIVVLWIAHVGSQSLPLSGQLVVAFIAALMSIGGSPIPSAGVSTLMLMVEAGGVTATPTVQMLVGFCLAIEWLLDSLRTAVNVTGDAIGVAVIDHLLRGQAPDYGEVSPKAWNAEAAPEELPPARALGECRARPGGADPVGQCGGADAA
mmetsp:Transcript_81050/g.251521  ORF Transcript_81050/g.251521 Transcript_81050/m.251521 type:complete len:491 (+) Transcript_81050:60-1532(+)